MSSEQLEGKTDIEFPLNGIPLTLSQQSVHRIGIETTIFYLEPEHGHLGSCQVIGCTEEAVIPRKFECFVVKVCSKHGEEFAPMKEG